MFTLHSIDRGVPGPGLGSEGQGEEGGRQWPPRSVWRIPALGWEVCTVEDDAGTSGSPTETMYTSVY